MGTLPLIMPGGRVRMSLRLSSGAHVLGFSFESMHSAARTVDRPSEWQSIPRRTSLPSFLMSSTREGDL